jgi:hypothetical protein
MGSNAAVPYFVVRTSRHLRCHTAWLVEERGLSEKTFFIHDSRDDGSLDQNRSCAAYEWHVHGPDAISLTAFCKWLSSCIVEHLPSPGRRLTARGREQVERWTREGKSLAEAAAAAEWEAAASQEDYSWPIAGRPPIKPACG